MSVQAFVTVDGVLRHLHEACMRKALLPVPDHHIIQIIQGTPC